jgi:hypothetical protein
MTADFNVGTPQDTANLIYLPEKFEYNRAP